MMTQLYTLPGAYFADTYGSGTYNNSIYSATGTNSTTSGTSAGGSTSPLENTGVYIVGFITIAAVILLVALVVRVWRRPSKQSK